MSTSTIASRTPTFAPEANTLAHHVTDIVNDSLIPRTASISSQSLLNDILPVEVLLKIFYAYVHYTGGVHRKSIGLHTSLWNDRYPRKPVILTHVCHAWRTSVVNDPSLWTGICVYDSSKIYSLFFRRSAPLPIDITIDLSMVPSPQQQRAVTMMLKKELDLKLEKDYCPCTDRIRSIRLISEGEMGAAFVQLLLEQYTLPALQNLFTRPATSESSMQGRHHAFSPGPLRPTLTRLELHHCCDKLGMDGLRAIFTSCPKLQTLVLGPTNLVVDPRIKSCELEARNPRIHTPALRCLALGSAIFARDSERPCGPGCPCVVGNLVADNLEYLEITGENQFHDTLRHVIPLIHRRAELDQEIPSRTLAVVLHSSFSGFLQPDQPSLCQIHNNVHLHLHTPRAAALISSSQSTMKMSWLTRPSATTLYLNEVEARLGKGRHVEGLENFVQLEPRRGVVPVLVHPIKDNPFQAVNGEKQLWIMSDDNGGPYHNATEFVVFDDDDVDELVDVLSFW